MYQKVLSRESSDAIIEKALERYYAEGPPKSIPDLLPLASVFCEDQNLALNTFKDVTVLFVQHHLGPLVPMVQLMCHYGIDISDCWFVDIPYSTNEEVRQRLLKIGVPKEQTCKPFEDPLGIYSKRQIERVEYVLSNILKKNPKKLLVIDDGAYFIRTLMNIQYNNKQLFEKIKRLSIKIVEQTTRGHVYLETENARQLRESLGIPVVSIARTKTKRELESPFIGASVARGVMRALNNHGRVKLGNVFILGFGCVGKATAKELSKLEIDQIDVFDKINSLSQKILEIGANPLATFPKTGSYNTVIGCTGKASVHNQEQLRILANGAVLISGSSAAIEFNREKFIEIAYRNERDGFFIIDPERTRMQGIHAPIRLSLDGKEFTFLNAGFPIDFDGAIAVLPTEIIQITHGLLVAAAAETISERAHLCSLNNRFDSWFQAKGIEAIASYANDCS
jgi:hypothetical protein